MTTDLVARDQHQALMSAEQEEAGMAALAHVLGSGDLSQLGNGERVGHYLRLCRSLGLNELSRPFDWIYFKGGDGEPEKLALYPNQSCAAQLRRQHHMRVQITRREVVGELFVCEATAYTPDGRQDVASKYVPLTNKYGRLKGNMLANAMMKAETGAKRRVTLSMVGLASPPDAEEAVSWRPVVVDGVGQVLANPTPEQKALAENPSMARVVGEPVYEDAEIGDGDVVSQAVRPEEIEQAEQPAVARPSFRTGEEEIRRLCGAWFAAVKGTSLDNDDARHRFVLAWTDGELEWPEAKRTDSLKTMFARMNEREAGDFLAHVRTIADDERRSYLEDAEAGREEPATARPTAVDQRVHDAVQLTGGPARGDGQAD